MYANVLKTQLFGYVEPHFKSIRGFDLISFQLHRTRIFQTFWVQFSIDTAWIHKTVQLNATLDHSYRPDGSTIDGVVFVCNISYESFSVVSVTIRQFAREMLLSSNRRKEKPCRSFGPLDSVVAWLLHNQMAWPIVVHHSFDFFYYLICDF